MLFITITLVLLLAALVALLQLRRADGLRYAVVLGMLGVLVVGGVWGALELSRRVKPPLAENLTSSPLVSKDLTTQPSAASDTCVKCHAAQFASWKKTFHRTMTREATPENVKGDFNDAVMTYNGVDSRMTRKGDRFFIDTVHPGWDAQVVSRGISFADAGPLQRLSVSVDRLVGSHWFQQTFHRSPTGRYVRLPLVYHIVEKRWIHINGAFLQPSAREFWTCGSIWNSSCLYCHNTRPSGNPYPIPNDDVPGYNTTVGELGISCEACHGPTERHVLAHQNPGLQPASADGEGTIVNPARLSVARSNDVCGRCHGAPFIRPAKWNRDTLADPFQPGEDLDRTWRVCWSEAEMNDHAAKEGVNRGVRKSSKTIDGRFWEDGTPLTTALEYQGMSLSACYQNGKGELRCVTCHSMHKSDPNHQLKDGMRTNTACYSCHETYRTRLVEHTHHAADSSGSLCMNCHMPHHVYSLLDTHRSHRIMIPRVSDSLNTGKPHACNLCHLDKSLGWTSEQLQKWYRTKPEKLTEEDRTVASSLLHLTRGDARSRAIVAGAFSSPAAHLASGRDWPWLLLTLALNEERYEAIRYLLHRSLRAVHGPSVSDYNFQGSPDERAAQLSALKQRLEQGLRPDQRRYPDLPLNEHGRFTDAVNRLLQNRSDPDIYIRE